ncbi:PEPxxWA-CTERM sorting domain-containing protein [Sphingomonas sp. 1P06PA]|uniref:PEPxxWA-CTERM sorting domain-containing protein n=1 Tax=Sphingomonas sp. 1P06PA TaxID=554121 RepID=UPI0039A73161
MRALFIGLATVAVAIAAPASAATVLLTFENAPAPGACAATNGGVASQQCTGTNQFVGRDYGTTAELAVLFQPYGSADLAFRTDDRSGGAGDLGTYSAGNSDAASGNYAAITFTPTAGYEVSFTSLNYFRGTATSAPARFRLLDENDMVVFTQDTGSPGTTNPTLAINSAYYSGPITLEFASFSGIVSIDDLLLDVRQIATAVPEPASWALMIGGFGMTGAALRRRGRPLARATA